MGLLLYNIDPRQHNSGNTGMSNVWRCCGPVAGLLTLLGDTAKALLSLWISSQLSSSLLLVGFFCVFFHCYSIYLSGKGGKGVATASGVILYFSIDTFLLAVIAWILIRELDKRASVASLLTVVITLLYSFFCSETLFPLIFGISILIFVRHKDNIVRLRSNEELHF